MHQNQKKMSSKIHDRYRSTIFSNKKLRTNQLVMNQIGTVFAWPIQLNIFLKSLVVVALEREKMSFENKGLIPRL